MLDDKLKPWLLEINHTPSFTTDTPLDRYIKENVVYDSLKIMNISVKNRIASKQYMKEKKIQRAFSQHKPKITLEEKKQIISEIQMQRDSYENQNLGNFTKLYPIDKNV